MKLVGDLLVETLRSVRAHALRFGLTSLGIAWGAAMLTFLSASTTGSELHFQRELKKTGPKVVWVFPGVITKDRIGERGARQVDLDRDDIDRVAALEVVEAASPNLLMWNRVVRAEGRTKLLTVFGLSADAASVRNFEVERGRFFQPHEVDAYARVAFLGAEAEQRLFGGRDAVGRTLRIDSLALRVIGVAARKGDQMVNLNGRDDTSVLIPFTTARRWLERSDHLEQFVVAPITREASGPAMRGMRSVLSRHHGFAPADEPALTFVSMDEILKVLDGMFLGLRLFVIAAGLITLLVGAVSVMNIMIVVVGERTQEIGLRKALGASDRAIFGLFLAEAMLVSIAAGLVGAVMGWLGIQASIAVVPPNSPVASTPVFDPVTAGAMVAALILVGVVSGILPALRASRVAPAESLRGA